MAVTNPLTEEELVAHRRGKWSVAGVPHRGWTCVDIEDLGKPQIDCEMCESQTTRYVHHMEHPDYPNVLEVGCVCAGHMEGDLAASQAREASMKSRAAKRKRWTTRAWKVSAKAIRISLRMDSALPFTRAAKVGPVPWLRWINQLSYTLGATTGLNRRRNSLPSTASPVFNPKLAHGGSFRLNHHKVLWAVIASMRVGSGRKQTSRRRRGDQECQGPCSTRSEHCLGSEVATL